MRVDILAFTFFVSFSATASTSIAQEDEDDAQAVRGLRVVIMSVKNPGSAGTTLLEEYGLKRDDQSRLRKIPGSDRVVPIRKVPADARFKDQSTSASVIGTTPDYAVDRDRFIKQGRFLTEKDVKQLDNVAVIDAETQARLFPRDNPIGKNLRIGKDYYLIVGVADSEHGREPKPERGRRRVPFVYIPISTMRSRMGDTVKQRISGNLDFVKYELSRIEIDAPVSEVDRISVAAKRLLEKSHDPKEFKIQIQSSPAKGK